MAKVKGFLTAYQKHLDKLRESGRTVIRLYYLTEMTCEEISKVLLSMKHKFLRL